MTTTTQADDALRQLVWSMAAQGLSSVTNFALVAILAVSAGPMEFGRLMATISVYLLALALTRALISEPMLAAGTVGQDGATATRRLWVAGGVAAVATATIGSVVGLEPSIALVIALAAPLLLQQDGQRYLAWIGGARSRVAALDLTWLVVSSLVLLFTTWLDRALYIGSQVGWRPLPGLVVVAWAAGGAASWIVALDASAPQRSSSSEAGADDHSPSGEETVGVPESAPSGTRDRRHRDLGVSQAIMAVAVNLGPLLVALALNPEVTGSVKALLIPFAPVLSLAAGIRLVTVPRLEALLGRSGGGPSGAPSGAATDQAARLLLRAAVAAAVSAALGASIVALLPAALVGPTFEAVEPYLPIGVAICVLHVVAQQMGDAVALAGRLTVVDRRLAAVGAEWSGLIVGALVAGTGGMAVGWLIGLAGGTAMWALAWWKSVADPIRLQRGLNPVA